MKLKIVASFDKTLNSKLSSISCRCGGGKLQKKNRLDYGIFIIE